MAMLRLDREQSHRRYLKKSLTLGATGKSGSKKQVQFPIQRDKKTQSVSYR
jgi:hypothetical protein